MDRSDFFKKLHKELAEKYNTTVEIVGYIRSNVIELKKTKQELLEYVDLKIKRLNDQVYYLKRKLKHPDFQVMSSLNRHYAIQKFLGKISDADFSDLTIKTEFDK